MLETEHTTTRKALTLNLDEEKYGTFAEIGAGQEVARHFFRAGHASNTVAKTMSAYDKTFSDAIYGKGSRFVSRERLKLMLEHEYELLESRLNESRGKSTCFFAYANTVATSSHESAPQSHCWLGLRFQTRPGGPANDVIIHVKMLDRMRLQQQEALGILGVNLVFGAFYLLEIESDFIASLTENLGEDRVEVDYIRVSGPDFEQIDSRLLCLELVRQGLSEAIIFGPDGKPCQVADSLYDKPVISMRGQFRPITTLNMEILDKSKEQFGHIKELGGHEPLALFEITMKSLKTDGQIDQKDFLERVDTIAALNQHVMVTNYSSLSEVKGLLRQCTDNEIVLVLGASSLEELLSPDSYSQLQGGIMEAFGSMFDHKTTLFIFPFKSNDQCLTTQSFFPNEKIMPLFQYLTKNDKIVDILGCDDVDTTVHSETVRKMMAEKDPGWEEMVPPAVSEMIKKKKFFGYS